MFVSNLLMGIVSKGKVLAISAVVKGWGGVVSDRRDGEGGAD